jgi:hypothetical protein
MSHAWTADLYDRATGRDDAHTVPILALALLHAI